MSRIVCRTPSTGLPETLYLVDVPATMTTLDGGLTGADAPDYSVPDPSNQYEVRDPSDPTRAILPGQIFFLTPLSVTNKTASDETLDVQIVLEGGNTIISLGTVVVPAFDTAYVPLNGRSLLKFDANSVNGDQLQVSASTANVFDVVISGDLSPASQNLGNVTIIPTP
jgi:hypothetical protein